MSQFFRPLNGIQYLTLMLIVFMAAGFIYGFSRIENAQRSIQASRLAACEDQNRRHDQTIMRLKREARQNEIEFPNKAEHIRESVKQTKALIDALAPRHDCRVAIK